METEAADEPAFGLSKASFLFFQVAADANPSQRRVTEPLHLPVKVSVLPLSHNRPHSP